MRRVMSKKVDLYHYWDLIVVITKKEIKIRYANNVLGYVWSIANPLAFALVFYVAFKIVMRLEMENYVLFLITGLFPWQWFSNSVNLSPTTFLQNASIIKKISFPRDVVVLAVVLDDMVHFLLALPVVILFLFIYGMTPSWTWAYGVPILTILQLAVTLGVSLMVATVNLFFRDMLKLTNIFIMMLFYITPVLYPENLVPERYHFLVSLNPLAPLMINWRNLLMKGTLNGEYLVLSLISAVLALIAGYWIFNKLSWRFAEVV